MAADNPSNRISCRVLVPLTLLVCGALVVSLRFNLDDCRMWLKEAGPWASLVFIIAGIASLSVLVPKTAVSITAGALFGTYQGGALMLIVAVAAAALNYASGRWWLHESVERKLQSVSDSGRGPWIKAVRDVAAEAGFQFHFLLRLTPVPTTLISYAMGASGSRVRPFLLAAAVAVIPQMLWVYGGAAASLIDPSSSSTMRWATLMVSVVAAISISIVVPKLAFRKLEMVKLR